MGDLLAYVATILLTIIGFFLIQFFKRSDKLASRVGRIEIDFTSHAAVDNERWENVHTSLGEIKTALLSRQGGTQP